jgi:predicted kinase
MSALIIVNGQPGTGKTTLALRLADALNIPCFRKDVYKEAAYDVFDEVTAEQNKSLGKLAMRLLYLDAEEVLRRGGSCIVEGNFLADLASDEYQKLIVSAGVRGCQVLVSCEAEVLIARFLSRANSGDRHPGHGDHVPEMQAAWKERLAQPFESLRLEVPLVNVDTTDFTKVDFESLLAQVRKTL